MVGYGGIRGQLYVWKFSTWESGDPASSLAKCKRQEGSINEGENPKN
jgi:hypothetical protein